MALPPQLVTAGSSSLTLRWTASGTPESFEVEIRKSAWLVSASWSRQAVPPEDAHITGSVGEVTLYSLEPQTAYDLRLAAVLLDGTRQLSPTATFRTLALAPTLHAAPCVKCARHDRLLLRWASSAVQADEVVAYRLRYFDDGPRWPVKREVEAKLASRLLRPSEQTTLFLRGLVAMRVPPVQSAPAAGEEADLGDDDSSEVHFWLMNLAPLRTYCVQVAAVTAGGQGQWSPLSEPLRTWRLAPLMSAPLQLFRSHATIVVGLSPQPPEDAKNGQDEEVDKIQITMQPERKGSQAQVEVCSRDKAVALAAALQQRLAGEPVAQRVQIPQYAIAISNLCPSSTYMCAARAITHAGVGDQSAPSKIETLSIPPRIADVQVQVIDHRSATLSWRVCEECMPPPLARCCLGDGADVELAERRLRGFKVRMADEDGHAWKEYLGVRASQCTLPCQDVSLVLKSLQPSSKRLVQVSAVTQGLDTGEWSEAVGIATQEVAPALEAPELDVVLRTSATLRWPSPQEIRDCPVLSYVLRVAKSGGKGRSPTVWDLELPLFDDRRRVSHAREAHVWLDGGASRAVLTDLEPGTSYVVQAAAKTSRGTGDMSTGCPVSTRLCAPMMADRGPRPIHAYHDTLILVCDGPVPDWSDDESSDVIGYSARYFECRRFGPHGPWVEREAVEYTEIGGESVQFTLDGLVAERQYIVQVAAVTPAGRGPWSTQSERASTWRLAPSLSPPQVLFRTHTALLLGWSRAPPEDAAPAATHDEEIREFALAASPAGASRPDAQSVGVARGGAAELAAVWRGAALALRDGGEGGAEAEGGGGEAEEGEEGERGGRGEERRAAEGEGERGRGERGEGEGEGQERERAPRAPAVTPAPGLRGGLSASSFEFVAAVQGLLPNSAYVATVCAISGAGKGHVSPKSVELRTLAVAPQVDAVYVDEVQHDQVQISWEHPRSPNLLTPAACEQLGLSDSLVELELRGYSVRHAAWTSWSRIQWKEPVYAEVETLSCTDLGRVQFTVSELEAEHQYVIEVRAHTARGSGEWRRHSEQSICTAIVALPPLAPELVYATPHTLTFSFAGVEDARVTAYEVRRWEGWGRASRPVRFDARSLAVRITSEKRWVVHMDQLRSNTTYTLQLRGITQTGGVTKWSAKSEAMCTLTGNGETEPDLGVGVNDELAAAGGGGGQQLSLSASPANTGAESVEDFSRKLEAVLSFMVDHAMAGVRLPSVRIPSVAERADELLRHHQGSRAAAVAEAARIDDDDGSWRTKLPDFLIQQVPVVGCSTLLLRELWRSIRRCALIAHLYGHDTASAETQALILTCLMPGGAPPAPGAAAPGPAAPGAAAAQGGAAAEDVVAGSRRVALLVSRALAKETFVRATGLKSAGQVVELLETAGGLLKNYSASEAGDDAALTQSSRQGAAGYSLGVNMACGSSASLRSRADDAEQPTPARVALVVFRPQNIEERPVVVFGFLAIWLLPILVSASRFVAAKLLPLLAKRIQMELPVAAVVALLLTTQVAGMMAAVWVQQNLTNFVSVPATLVFTLYSMLPGISVLLAMRSLLQGFSEAPYFALLGVFNLASGYLRWADDVSGDAALEQRPAPRAVHGRAHVQRARRWLWVLLLVDFAAEELLGRVCGLHSLRLLGPATADARATLAEYRTLSFAAGLLAAWAQARLLELLQHRAVLLRLLGAQKALFAGLTLLLMGAFAVAQQARTVQFLREVSPAPAWCCTVLWLRHFGAVFGAAVPVAFYVLLEPRYLGALPVDVLVPIAVVVGALLGNFFCQSFTALWLEKKEHLESDYRVLHLFPHMSSQARGKAAVVMRLAFRRGAEATTNTAVEWAASRMVRTAADYAARLLAGRTALARP